jgi:brefeldin A-resistance guanine nucleotide exchange factor 1
MSNGAPVDSLVLETIETDETSTLEPNTSTSHPPREYDSSFSQTNGFSMENSRRGQVSVAVDPVALIITECITVTSAMRKHARWAHSSVSAILGGSSTPMSPSFQSRPSTPRDDTAGKKGTRPGTSNGFVDMADEGGLANRWGLRGKKGKSMQDNPLMAGFGRLRRELTGCKGRGTMCYCSSQLY